MPESPPPDQLGKRDDRAAERAAEQPPESNEPPHSQSEGMPRRQVLQAVGAVSAGAALVPYARGADLIGGWFGGSPRAELLSSFIPGAAPDLAFQVIRIQDMLYLGFQFYNAHTEVTNGQTHIVATNKSKPTYMVVVFPAQSLGEESVPFPLTTKNWPAPPLRGALAGLSWLAFRVPPALSIPLTATGLLHWSMLTPQLVPVASTPGNRTPAPPDPLHTALEFPWSMWLTPMLDGTWHHSAEPVSFQNRTELWHTRLGKGSSEPPDATPQIKAFWSNTFGMQNPTPDPWLMSVPQDKRTEIVQNTSVGQSVVSFTPPGPAQVNLLALTALGASVNLAADWTPGAVAENSLISWRHRSALGRDSYVKLVSLGHLFPFGHRAVKIAITNRQFQADQAGNVVAYLVTEEFISVVQPTISFAGDAHEPSGGRGNPMRSIEIKTITTPPIAFLTSQDPKIVVGSLSTDQAIWIRANGEDFPFSCVATDLEGRTADFASGAIWVDLTVTSQSLITQIIAAYDGAAASRRTSSLGGRLFAFAEASGGKPGSTAQHVSSYTHGGQYAVNKGPNFYPVLNEATIHLPGAEQLTGAGSTPLPGPTVAISQNYLDNGFQTGVVEVYLQVNSNGPSLTFPAKAVGGMATPNFDVTGISRDLGPVGGSLSNLLAGNFNPSDYFSTSGPAGTLLGAIKVFEIIEDPNGPSASDQAPTISTSFIYPNNNILQPPDAIDTKITWSPAVQADPAGFFKPNSSTLTLTADIITPISTPDQSTYTIHGQLTSFTLVLFGSAGECIDVDLSSLTFDVKTGAKPSIKPKISGVQFVGPLSFIADLASLLSSIGGPSISVTDGGINASYSMPLPDVSLGVFGLTNLSISAAVNIPFDGTPVRFRFALCSQDNPFILSIYIFGGGGFFSVALGADGIEQIQVELEFGAAISINLGVASGGVSVMAGIYFSLQTTPSKQVQLTGFFRACGSLSILGIVKMSMEFYLGLTYLNPGQSYGTATVTVSVTFLCFSGSVSATMQKTLGGGGDPTFQDAISKGDWTSYCEAFAS